MRTPHPVQATLAELCPDGCHSEICPHPSCAPDTNVLQSPRRARRRCTDMSTSLNMKNRLETTSREKSVRNQKRPFRLSRERSRAPPLDAPFSDTESPDPQGAADRDLAALRAEETSLFVGTSSPKRPVTRFGGRWRNPKRQMNPRGCGACKFMFAFETLLLKSVLSCYFTSHRHGHV